MLLYRHSVRFMVVKSISSWFLCFFTDTVLDLWWSILLLLVLMLLVKHNVRFSVINFVDFDILQSLHICVSLYVCLLVKVYQHCNSNN